jgi:divalent metal cation (Fe/Co/Zn/Cd) transporter
MISNYDFVGIVWVVVTKYYWLDFILWLLIYILLLYIMMNIICES